MPSHSFYRTVADLVSQTDETSIEKIGELVFATGKDARRVYVAGNGGSAATAQHFCNDLMGVSLKRGRYGMTPVCLSSNISLFSALSNDYGYEEVFVKQLEGRIGAGDVLILFSVSGASLNCVKAAKYARASGAKVAGVLGFDGGPIGSVCNLKVVVPSDNYFAVECCHLMISHGIADGLDQILSSDEIQERNRATAS